MPNFEPYKYLNFSVFDLGSTSSVPGSVCSARNYSSNPTFLVAPSSENYSASSWKGNPKNLLGIHGVIWCYTAHSLIS